MGMMVLDAVLILIFFVDPLKLNAGGGAAAPEEEAEKLEEGK